ncbi:MAG: kelch repeat-containing protein [Myxococcota bacterium]
MTVLRPLHSRVLPGHLRRLVVVALALGAACTTPPPGVDVNGMAPGTVRVRFTWPKEPRYRERMSAWLHVVDRDNPSATSVSDGPFDYRYTEPVNRNLQIPNGRSVVVTLELRPTPDSTEVYFRGVSQPREIRQEDPTPVNIEVPIIPTPCREVDDEKLCLAVLHDLPTYGELPYTNSPQVQVVLVPPATAVHVQLSNTEDMKGAATREFELARFPLEEVAVGTRGRKLDWDLTRGLSEDDWRCHAEAGCLRTIYARFLDGERFAGPLLLVPVMFDQQGPALLTGAGEILVEPNPARASSVLTVRLRANEILRGPPTLQVDESPAFVFRAPSEGVASDVYTFTGAAAGLLGTDGVYTVRALLKDIAGNPSHELPIVGTLELDTHEPELLDLVVSTVPRPGATSVDTTPQSSLPARVGRDTVTTVSFTSEDLTPTPEEAAQGRGPSYLVSLAGQPVLPCQSQALVGEVVRYTCGPLHVQPQPGQEEQEIGDLVTVSAVDRAGNQRVSESVRVVLDFRAPDVTTQAFPTRLRVGDELVFSAGFSEPLDPQKQPVLHLAGEDRLPSEPPLGLLYRWRIPAASLGDGHHVPTVLAEDVVGNAVAATGEAFDVDVTPPAVTLTLVGGVPGANPPRFGPAHTICLVVDTEADATITAAVAGVGLTLSDGTDGCALGQWRLGVDAAPFPDADETGTLIITSVADAFDNVETRQVALVVDRRAPRVTHVDVQYEPPGNHPLPSVTAAGPGTVVRLDLTTDEPVDPTTVRVCVGSADCAGLQLIRAGDSDDTHLVFLRPADGTEAVGVHALYLQARDAAGNLSTPALGTTVEFLHYDGSARVPLVVEQQQVGWTRSPWGAVTTETSTTPDGGAGHVIPAQRHFALSPGRERDARGELSGDAFQVADAGAPLLVRVWARPSPFVPADFDVDEEVLLGTLSPSVDGGWPRTPLSNVDAPGVVVTAVDRAGNESLPVAVERNEWVAVPRVNSPHTVALLPSVGTALQPPGGSLSPQGGTDGVDGVGEQVASVIPWTSVDTSTTRGGQRFAHAAAYDPVRERMVVFAGYGGTDDVREWDGRQFTVATPEGFRPAVRAGAVMAFDALRGRVLMAGGSVQGVPVPDAWEWDGERWTRLPDAPISSGMEGAGSAYDTLRGRWVIFGGGQVLVDGPFPLPLMNDALREWDGTQWLTPAQGSPRPSPRLFPAAAFDAEHGTTVLFGGFGGAGFNLAPRNDTWTWNGSGWTQHTSGPTPPPRVGGAMAYDPVRGVTVLFGGCLTLSANLEAGRPDCDEALGDTWEWDGASWTEVIVPSSPEVRALATLVEDPRFAGVLLFGGAGGGQGLDNFLEDVWRWDGTAWTEVTPGTVDPPPFLDAAVVWNASRRELVAVAGSVGDDDTQDTWIWDGSRWRLHTQTEPLFSPRARPQVGYNRDDTSLLLFGGQQDGNVFKDAWRFDGTRWTALAAVPNELTERSRGGMAYDERRHVMVLFAGRDGNETMLNDTWEWDGVTWTQRTPNDPQLGPAARREFAMTYDASPGRRRVLVFGGNGNPAYLGDLWEWDGDAGAWLEVVTSGESPVARRDASLFHDRVGERVLLFGGQQNDGLQFNDLWELRGNTWRRLPVSADGPTPRMNAALVVDETIPRVFLHGGLSTGPLSDSWATDIWSGRQAGVQVTFSVDEVAALDVTSLELRARAGGAYAGGNGASLQAWSAYAPALRSPGWTELTRNGAAATDVTDLTDDDTGLVWSSPSETEARRLIQQGAGRLSVQVRAGGPSAPGNGTPSQVVVDHVEARVHYTLPAQD